MLINDTLSILKITFLNSCLKVEYNNYNAIC